MAYVEENRSHILSVNPPSTHLPSISGTKVWVLFYREFVVNLFGILPYAGINLALYETLKDAYLLHQLEKNRIRKTKRPPAIILLTIGTLSSSCGQIVVYPLALVRTKLQVSW